MKNRRDEKSGFAGFEGEIELDTPAAQSEGVGSQGAQRSAAGSSQPAPAQASTEGGAPPAWGPQSHAPAQAGEGERIAQGGARRSSVREAPTDVDGSVWAKVIVLGLLLALSFGGYYGYCAWKAGNRLHSFYWAVQDFRNDLMRLSHKIGKADIRAAIEAHGKKAGVVIEKLSVSIEPMNPASMSKLPEHVRSALGMIAGIARHRAPQCVIGFQAEAAAQHGFVTKRSKLSRYTYFEDVSIPCGPPPKAFKAIDFRGMR